MIAVIFEVWPKPQHKDNYLAVAGALRTELENIEGFISVERFSSIVEEGKLLSLSFFEDEQAVIRWRNTDAHRKAQSIGRNEYFSHYRLRIANVLRDYGLEDRNQVPDDSKALHD